MEYSDLAPTVPANPQQIRSCAASLRRIERPHEIYGAIELGRALASADQLRIRSLMAENGVIFSDGIEADRLDFNAGAEVAIGIAARRGRLIV